LAFRGNSRYYFISPFSDWELMLNIFFSALSASGAAAMPPLR